MSKPGQLTHAVPGPFYFPQQTRQIGATAAEVLAVLSLQQCCPYTALYSNTELGSIRVILSVV